jgi:hypothetical protein
LLPGPAWWAVGGAPEEVTAFAPLLVPPDLAEVVVTTDALQTRPGAAEFLVASKQAHYLFVVNANQSTLLDRCQRLPWHRGPQLDRTRDRGHGRIELRTLKADSIHANIQQHHRKHPQPPADRHEHNNPAQRPRTTPVPGASIFDLGYANRACALVGHQAPARSDPRSHGSVVTVG